MEHHHRHIEEHYDITMKHIMILEVIITQNSELRTQNSENYLFNPNITFYISLNEYIKLINSFGFGRHLLRQDIVAGTDATLGCFKQNSFNIHII